MSLALAVVYLIIPVVLIGVVVYLVTELLPLDNGFRLLVRALAMIVVLLWLGHHFGLLPRHL